MPTTSPHPWRYAALYFPMGLMIGYPSVALGYLSSQAGLPVSTAASMVGMAFFAHAFKFLWAPLADYSLVAQDLGSPGRGRHVRGARGPHAHAHERRQRAVARRARAVRQPRRDLRGVRHRRPDGAQRRTGRARARQRLVPERQPVRTDGWRRTGTLAHAAPAAPWMAGAVLAPVSSVARWRSAALEEPPRHDGGAASRDKARTRGAS